MSPAVGLRRSILVILLLGMAGSTAELLLLDHYEDVKQLIPLTLFGLAAAVLAWHALHRRAASLRALQATMVLFLASGVAGTVLHYRANMEFQLDIDPSLGGMELFWKVMHAKAPPALAPGVMMQLGLLGLAYTWRHPALAAPGDDSMRKGA
jgi:hypothetical protein